MTTLHIEVETVTYDAGTADEETLQEVECSLLNTGTKPIIYEYSLSATDYPDLDSVEAYVTADLAERGITWDAVETVEAV